MTGEPPILSAEERQRRQEAVDYARASATPSGFAIDAQAQAPSDRYVQGQLSLGEFLAG
jgi:hypothetical protein